jgi:type I restriction enzyme, S subunit
MQSEDGGGVLGDYVELQRGTTYKSGLLDQPGPVLLGLSSISRNGGFRDDSLRPYGGDSPERLLLRPGQLYVSLKDVTQSGDLLGAIARVPEKVRLGRLTQDTVRLDITDPMMPPTYLYWLLRAPQYRAYCRSHATGTTNLGLSRADFLAFKVPPLTDMRRGILLALDLLDEKIESNRRLASTLENIAAALFKGRFVDFVGLDDFIESEIGPIPRGWSATPVGNLARYVNGKAFTKFGNGRGRMVIRIAELRSGPGASTVYSNHETEPDFMAAPGDLLFAWSGSLDVYRWHRSQALINQHIFKVIPADYPGWFVFYALKHVMPHFQVIAADKATTMGHIKRADLHAFSVAVPPSSDLQAHGAAFSPLFERSLAARMESETLAEVRDHLLPRLISGQLRAPSDAELVSESS